MGNDTRRRVVLGVNVRWWTAVLGLVIAVAVVFGYVYTGMRSVACDAVEQWHGSAPIAHTQHEAAYNTDINELQANQGENMTEIKDALNGIAVTQAQQGQLLESTSARVDELAIEQRALRARVDRVINGDH